MTRSVWKGPYVHPSILKKVDRALKDEKLRYKVIKTWSRSSSILPSFIGLKFGVYNGKKFIPVEITEHMIGKKLGEFSPTRIYHVYTAKDKSGKGKAKAKGKK